MLESAVSQAIIQWINTLPNARACKNAASMMSGSGEPDILAVIYNHHTGYAMPVFIETKRPGERPRVIQKYCLDRWRDTGAVAIVAVSLLDAKKQLAHPCGLTVESSKTPITPRKAPV